MSNKEKHFCRKIVNDMIKVKFRGVRKEIMEILTDLDCRNCAHPIKARKEIMKILSDLDCHSCEYMCGGFEGCAKKVADKIMKLIFAVD